MTFICAVCLAEATARGADPAEALVKHPTDRYYHTEEWVRHDGLNRLGRVTLEKVCRRHAQEQHEAGKAAQPDRRPAQPPAEEMFGG